RDVMKGPEVEGGRLACARVSDYRGLRRPLPNEAFRLEISERLPHRDKAHLKAFGEVRLTGERRAHRWRTAEDRIAQYCEELLVKWSAGAGEPAAAHR